MIWTKVTLEKSADETSSGALLATYMQALVAAGLPADAELYHGETQDQGQVFYFSPRSSEIMGDRLKAFAPESCVDPDVSGLSKIKL